MAHLAAPVRTLLHALPLSWRVLGAAADDLANDGRLGVRRHARRLRTIRHPRVSGPRLRPTDAAALLRRTLRRQHDLVGERPTHVLAAADHGPAQLRDRPGKAAGKLAEHCAYAGWFDSRVCPAHVPGRN